MAASVDTPSPIHLSKERKSLMGSSPLIISPSSDKRLWNDLRSRVDKLLENRKCEEIWEPNSSLPSQLSDRESDLAELLKEDSLLLLRGFDSVANYLSQLSNNIGNALQGAKDLAKQPTLTEIFHSNLINSESKEEEDSDEKGSEESSKKILKRRFDPNEYSEKQEEGNSPAKKNEQQGPVDDGNLKRAKHLAVSMATKAASLTRELKLVKTELCFMEERCALIEEENRRLRDGFSKGIRPEEDDLVRLQLEALLAEKSRLASENANLIRENQCLNQLVEYHQVTSQDLSASYDQVIGGLCLDFSSPPRTVPEEELDEEEAHQTPKRNRFSDSLDD